MTTKSPSLSTSSAAVPGYTLQHSEQTLAEGLEEYFDSFNEHLATRMQSTEARAFFDAHDAAHIIFGCDISLRDEAIVKVSSMFGTSAGLGVLRGYALAESKEIYSELTISEIITTAAQATVNVPRTIWRCVRMPERWPWHYSERKDLSDVPLVELRERFAILTPN